MKLYNQLTKKIDNFKPRDPENVKIYTCGPTVYSYAHIGNFSSYIYWDLLIRALELNDYKVNRVLNLTDVGHLASDADDGEDKLEKGAKKEGKSVWQIADYYIDAFLKDFHRLNLKEPAKIARATDYIEQDIELVDKLTEKGYTYETSDGIYFDSSKFKTYADFANLDLENLQAGARVAMSSEKKNTSDFAVWKFIREGEDHAMRWNYLGRPGYPGWHLECSTIIHTLLGEPIDIHTGGIDHIPVHHTNEIAQTEAAYETKLSNFWLHNKHLSIDNQKISKSLGNIYTLDDLEEKDFSPLDFKLWILQGHYQGERNFSFDDLEAAKTRRLNWRNRIAYLYQNDIISDFDQKEALDLVSNNLNSSEVCAYIDQHDLNLSNWKFIDELFGLNLINDSPNITEEEYQMIKDRNISREKKDFATSDRIRDEFLKKNIILNDGSEGTTWAFAK